MFQILNVVGFPHFNCHAHRVGFVCDEQESQQKMEQVTLKWKFLSFCVQIVSFDGTKNKDFLKIFKHMTKSTIKATNTHIFHVF